MLRRFCCLLMLLVTADLSMAAEPLPNIVIILADDLGYGDVGCFGAKDIRTPNLDALAQQGMRLTSFYVPQAVCTASRAGLMSGCYPNRVGLAGALNHTSTGGIQPSEWLLPEMLHAKGYLTACLGKWHLGTVPQLRATRHGFDYWFGIPYSNDNSKYHPVLKDQMPPLPLHENDTVIEEDPDQSTFTNRLTEKAIQKMDEAVRRQQPFFIYLPHVMPHVPIFASPAFKGRSQRGLFGDVVEELDDSVGKLLKKLDELKITDNTIVVFYSDNGPWLSYGEHGGSAGVFREGKLTTFEGGVRVPCIARWPNKIASGSVCNQPVMSIDLLPTITQIVGGQAPELKIDGLNIKSLLLTDPNGPSPHEALFFYAGDELHAVRSGKWKLHFAHPYLTTAGEPGRGGKPSNWGKGKPRAIDDSSMDAIASRHGQRVAHLELSLFDLEADPGEQNNVAPQNSDIVQRLSQLAEPIRKELGDKLTGAVGHARR